MLPALLRRGGHAAPDLRLAAAALLLPAGREAGVPVPGGAEGGDQGRQRQQQEEEQEDQDQDLSSERKQF